MILAVWRSDLRQKLCFGVLPNTSQKWQKCFWSQKQVQKHSQTGPETASVNSALHWTQSDDYVRPNVSLVSFDLVNESFHQVEMPKNLMLRKGSDHTHVSRYGDSIALFETGFYEGVADFDLWVMKEYGVAESWTKLCTVSFPMVYILRPFGFRRTGEVVVQVAHDGDLYEWDMLKMLKLVDPKSKQVKDFGTDGCRYHFVGSFTESLVLLDQANAISY